MSPTKSDQYRPLSSFSRPMLVPDPSGHVACPRSFPLPCLILTLIHAKYVVTLRVRRWRRRVAAARMRGTSGYLAWIHGRRRRLPCTTRGPTQALPCEPRPPDMPRPRIIVLSFIRFVLRNIAIQLRKFLHVSTSQNVFHPARKAGRPLQERQ